MKLGILPLGNHAKNRIIPNLPGTGFEVSAILSRNPERVREDAKKLGAEVYGSAEDFFGSDFEAVYISSPNSRHFPDTKLALENGKHVLLEKQMTLHYREAEELVALAKEKKLALNIGYHLRFHPAVNDVLKLIHGDEIGRIVEVSGKWCGYSGSYSSRDPVRDWWHDPKMVGGGSVMGTGVHVIDTIMRIGGGLPDGISGWRTPRNEVIDSSFQVNLYYGDHVATALSSRQIELPENSLRILGTEGFIEVTSFFSVDIHSELYLNGERRMKYQEGSMYSSEMFAFMDSIKGNESSIATGQDGANVVRVINAAVESIKNNRVVDPSSLS